VPLVGARRRERLTEALGALELELTPGTSPRWRRPCRTRTCSATATTSTRWRCSTRRSDPPGRRRRRADPRAHPRRGRGGPAPLRPAEDHRGRRRARARRQPRLGVPPLRLEGRAARRGRGALDGARRAAARGVGGRRRPGARAVARLDRRAGGDQAPQGARRPGAVRDLPGARRRGPGGRRGARRPPGRRHPPHPRGRRRARRGRRRRPGGGGAGRPLEHRALPPPGVRNEGRIESSIEDDGRPKSTPRCVSPSSPPASAAGRGGPAGRSCVASASRGTRPRRPRPRAAPAPGGRTPRR
jgi:hypothetical protein